MTLLFIIQPLTVANSLDLRRRDWPLIRMTHTTAVSIMLKKTVIAAGKHERGFTYLHICLKLQILMGLKACVGGCESVTRTQSLCLYCVYFLYFTL